MLTRVVYVVDARSQRWVRFCRLRKLHPLTTVLGGVGLRVDPCGRVEVSASGPMLTNFVI